MSFKRIPDIMVQISNFTLRIFFQSFQGKWKLIVKEGIEAQLEAVSGSCNHLPRLPDDDDEEDNDEEDNDEEDDGDDDEEDNDEEDDGDDDGDDDDDDDADDYDDDSSREPLTMLTLW